MTTTPNEKSPAPELASEAADSGAHPARESIVDARAAAGNETSSKVGREDALTDDKIIDEIGRAAGYDWPTGYRPQRGENTGYFFTYGELADLIRGLLAASPVEQPAADEASAYECTIDFGLGATLKPGPRVSFADGMREAARLIQLWQSMQPAYRQLHSAFNRDASRIIAFWPGRLREVADDPAVEQPAAAPIDDEQRIEAMARAMNMATDGHDRYWTGFVPSAGAALRALRDLQPAPAPADERAAFEWPLLPALPDAVVTTAGGEPVYTAHQMQGYANAYGESVRTARAASAIETGAEGAIVGAWRTEDGRAISAEQKAGMLRDGGAGASSVRPYSIPCYLGAAPAMAAEAVAWIQHRDGVVYLDTLGSCERLEDFPHGTKLYAAPQPALADAREGLTDEQRASCAVAADLAHANGLKSIASDLRKLAAHSGQLEPHRQA
ncbi:hypothetical protein [Burkholderia stabilis]|uniref:hypothetical protein n=1 Tax=Burkholderia stabilis TaxID=95485 RepID=UPI001F4B7416|nr:hypothetical protein [Burkholderia stabilis]